MDGRNLIEVIRSDQRLPDIPIVIISGVVNDQEVGDLTAKGATTFLKKPFGLEDIRSVVSDCLPLESRLN
jgi:CheY-like chemotaxis protein